MRVNHFRRSCVGLLAGAALIPLVGRSQAPTARFPTRSVSIIVGFPPGGATDVTARISQPPMQRLLGQPVIVENVAGAGGSIGVQRMLTAAPDGHSLYLGTASDTVLAPMSIASARYRAESLRLVALLGVTDFAIVVRPTLPAGSLDDFITLARKTTPSLSYASFGNGSIYHLIGEDLRARAGLELLHVPFQGMGPTVTSVAGGQVDIAFLPLAGQTVGLIRDGRVKALAVTGPRRNPQLPELPTVDESTGLKGFHHNIWLGVFGPAALPAETATMLNRLFGEAMQANEYVKFSRESGTRIPDPVLSLSQAEAFYTAEITKFQRLAKSIKLEAN